MSYDAIMLCFLTVLTVIRPSNVWLWVYHLFVTVENFQKLMSVFAKFVNQATKTLSNNFNKSGQITVFFGTNVLSCFFQMQKK